MIELDMKYLYIIFMLLLLFACGESSDNASDSDSSNKVTSEY